jgi:4a-hydroxytetrahydrobiopterin dehydratase
MDLTSKSCTPCQGGLQPLSLNDAEHLLKAIPNWTFLDNASKLKRTFKFKNFLDALAFTQRVGELCEAENHHADITVGWGYTRVIFQTHKINGLHENDFIMAAKTNLLFEQL